VFTLAEVVPWGRSFDEYRRMFALSAADVNGRILGCADGPASFSAEATEKGFSVVSSDPLYRFSPADIRQRIADTTEIIIEPTRRNQEEFHLAAIREMARVASEVRVFPLVALGSVPSPHIGRVSERLGASGFAVSIETVRYEFQRGGNQMMRVRLAA
jgi:hypothetical protein